MAWYKEIPTNDTLDQWIKNNCNVLIHGLHGIGKTSLVFDAFNRQGWKLGTDYLYFSAPTMDPHTDIYGVPFVSTNSSGVKVLEMIRPANINNLSLKAIFIDEVNRSHKKIRNALMELIQFKSINGTPFPSLRVVWAAVNPDSDDDLKFDVEKLDPAQEDRFHIHVEMPYEPNKEYFAKKFNDPDMANAVVEWWKKQHKDVRLKITPRRLEYAIDIFKKTDELCYTLPIEAELATLKMAIESGNPEKILQKLIKDGDEAKIRKWLAVDNNLNGVEKLVCRDVSVMDSVLHLISDERLTSFAVKHKPIQEQLKANPKKYTRIIKDLAENSTNKVLKNLCEKLLPFIQEDHNLFSKINISTKSRHDLKLTKRRRDQILNNYSFVDSAYSGSSYKKTENSHNNAISFITNLAFVTDIAEAVKLFEKISDSVYDGMSIEQTTTIIKIVEHVISNIENYQMLSTLMGNYQTGSSILNNNSNLIYFILSQWKTLNNKIHPMTDHLLFVKLFEEAPYLVTKVLCVAADAGNETFGIKKISNEEYLNISEEPEYAYSNNDIGDILGE